MARTHDALRPRAVALLARAGVAALLVATAAHAAMGDGPAGEVKLLKVRPASEKLRTLRFLDENRDFIRAALDRLREKPVERRGAGAAIDPRFLEYRAMLDAAAAARDTVGQTADAHARRELLENVTRLGTIEDDLDRLERQLDAQRTRLRSLDEDFTGRQRTELLVVASGVPSDAAIAEIELAVGDGEPVRVPFTDAQREALARGAVIELFHGLVEPRSQELGLTVRGAAFAEDAAFGTIEPARDRFTILRLDLSGFRPELGAQSIRAHVRQDDAARVAAGG